MVEVKGHLWHFKYPHKGRSETLHRSSATTRPETMLGDTGWPCIPKDERFTDLGAGP